MAKKGIKFDSGKLRWSLLPYDALADVVRVLMHGAAKYEDFNWQHVVSEDGGKARYFDALQRHLIAWWNGEINDPEDGLSHLAHATCCLLFLLWKERNGE